jgi:hypothetical protein
MNFSAQTTSQLDCKLVKWTLTQEQTNAIEKAWDSYKDYWESTKEEFLNQFKGFTIYPLKNKNGVIGCSAVKDNEIHVFSTEHFYMRNYIRSILIPLFNTYEEVISTVHIDNIKGLEYVTRLGFKPYKQINNKIYIRITQNGLCC